MAEFGRFHEDGKFEWGLGLGKVYVDTRVPANEVHMYSAGKLHKMTNIGPTYRNGAPILTEGPQRDDL